MDDEIQLIQNVPHNKVDVKLTSSVKYDSSLETVKCDFGGTVTSDDNSSDAETTDPQIKKKSLFSKITYFANLNDLNQISLHPYLLLMLLLLIYVLNQADRLVLPVVIPSGLRCEVSSSGECNNSTSNSSDVNGTSEDCISFNDFEQGLITGPAFTIVYVLCGLPISRVADKWSRSITLLIGLTTWSFVAFFTGFVQTFWQLLLLRIFLGIGEVSIYSEYPCMYTRVFLKPLNVASISNLNSLLFKPGMCLVS